jgi:hypothetical protein
LALLNRTILQARTSSSGPKAESCKSLGLKALFDALNPDRKYSFLDLGSAFGPNIDFLSQFSSRIRVEDLYTTLAAQQFFERREGPLDEAVFGRAFSAPCGESYDIILSWDIVNYFRPDEVRVLVRHIERLSLPGSLCFAIISTRKEMPAVPINFRILDAETLLYTADSSETLPCPRYAPRDLSQLMPGFQTQSCYMLRNGMQEYLFVRD